jgi:hypothetical protein
VGEHLSEPLVVSGAAEALDAAGEDALVLRSEDRDGQSSPRLRRERG